jgi:tellurite resistance protein TerA
VPTQADEPSEEVGTDVSGIDWNTGGQQPFTRIALTSADPDRSLSRSGAGSGTLRVNLRWSNPEELRRGGVRVLRRRLDPDGTQGSAAGPKVDLDLGCLYQFTDGQRGVVQAAGARHGNFARPPYVRLDRDDRTGSSTGENLFISMDQSAHFERLLIFVLLAGGAEDLTKVGAVITLYPTSGPALELRLDGQSSLAPVTGGRYKSCAAVLIRRQGTEFMLKTESKFYPGYQSEIDKAYAWGLHWAPGPGKVRI